MVNTTKSNKLKRKRGKKFVFNSGEDQSKGDSQASNPFEDHVKSKRMKKDEEKRQELVTEYRRLGKNSMITDNRLGEQSSKLSEEDKMRLRYMREQRDQAKRMIEEADEAMANKRMGKLSTKVSEKRSKFQLESDDDDDGEVFMGFTHKGKKLDMGGMRDDFDEQIDDQSSDDEESRRKKNTGFYKG